MLYLLHGEDTYRSREKLSKLVGVLAEKAEDGAVFKIDALNFNAHDFEVMFRTDSLFFKKHIIVCERVMESDEGSSFFLKRAGDIAASSHVCVVWEENLPEDILRAIHKVAEKTQKFNPLSPAKLKEWFKKESPNLPERVRDSILKKCGGNAWCLKKESEKMELGGDEPDSGGKTDQSPFVVSDLVLARERLKAWVAFQKWILGGRDAAEMFWKVWWQMKVLMIVRRSPENNGLHPYVARKAAAAGRSFNDDELRDFLWRMVKMYHEERLGKSNLSLEFEKFLLEL